MNVVRIILYSVLSFGVLFSPKTRAQTAKPKSYRLFVNLDNAPFDALYLHDYTEGRDILIGGKKIKKFTWEIIVPDSIVWNSESMELIVSQFDSTSNSSQSVRFISEKNNKKTVVVNVGLEDEKTYIFGRYSGKSIFSKQPIKAKINNIDSIILGDAIYEDFSLIAKERNSDIAVRFEDPFFSWFNNGLTYESRYASYLKISKGYPGSRFLMTNLSLNLNLYKSKEDVKRIYNTLSSKHKNTLWAKNIERFLYIKKFPNTSLTALGKNTHENIVQDSSKYNMIIFSASWCAPCIEEIPILKKIHTDLGANLISTYVSVDDAQGAAAFKKLIREKDIPWRTLLAYPDIKKIKQKYFIVGIPHTMLIYPNQDIEVIDVRKKEDLSKLYSIIKAK